MGGEAEGRSGTVLVIEDDRSLLLVLAYNLRRAGFAVVEADDGPSGLAAAQRAGRDLVAVVLDRMLPGMDGLDVLRELRADPALRHAGVVVISASIDPETRAAALAAGANAFVPKPFGLEELVQQVRRSIVSAG